MNNVFCFVLWWWVGVRTFVLKVPEETEEGPQRGIKALERSVKTSQTMPCVAGFLSLDTLVLWTREFFVVGVVLDLVASQVQL